MVGLAEKVPSCTNISGLVRLAPVGIEARPIPAFHPLVGPDENHVSYTMERLMVWFE
jgi:hypothetical protein